MLQRYVIREVLKPSIVVLGIFVVMFAGYSWMTFLAQAADALLPVKMLLNLIALKVVIALEVLLPVSLYLGVVLGLGRLYADSEMKALMACGVSPYRILGIVCSLACMTAVVVGIFSLYLRPMAYSYSYQFKAQAEAGFGISNLDPGHFYERRNGSLVFFAHEIEQKNRRLHRVFVQSASGDTLRVFSAKEAEERRDAQSGIPVPVLLDGFEYKLTREGQIKHISSFSQLAIYPQDIESIYKRKAEPTKHLFQSESLRDIAELHWRFSTPVSAILIGVLGVPLSRAAPRQGKYSKIFAAIVIFAVYYFLGLLVLTLVEQGNFPAMPGLWTVLVLLALFLIWLLAPSRFAFIRS